jgi:signal transduction histidine kinase
MAIFSQLRVRLLALFIALGIVPLALGEYFIFRTASETILNQSRQQLLSLADKTVQQIGVFFEEREKDLGLLAGHPLVQLAFLQWEFGQRLNEVRGRLEAYQRENELYRHIVLVTPQGRSILRVGTAPAPEGIADAPWFGETLKSGRGASFLPRGPDGSPALVMARTVSDFEEPKRVVGTLVFFISFSAVSNLVTDLAKDQSGEAFLVERATGGILAHSDLSRRFTTSPLLHEDSDARGLIARIARGERGWGSYGRGRDQRVVAFSGYAEKGWVVGITRVTASLMTEVYRLRWFAAALVVGLTVVVGAASWIFAARITDPILKLRKGTRAFAEGDLTRKIRVSGAREIRDLAEEFNKMASRLQDTVRQMMRVDRLAALGELASGIAHEVRNPLAGMKTSAQVLATRATDEESRSLVDGIQEEIERLDRMVTDLLNFARPTPPALGAHEVAPLLDKSLALIHTHLRKNGVRLVKECGAVPSVRVDPNQLQQIFLNFFLNSLKAMPGGGTLTVRLFSHPEEREIVRVEISDTGVGIPPEQIDRVFDPFFTTDPRGVGLGLSVVHTLVRENGGSVGLASEPGKGTRVTLRLPAAAAE